jgi:DNA-binding response OmpR family regulator
MEVPMPTDRRIPFVLIVEDDESIAAGMHNALVANGYTVRLAHSAAAATAALEDGVPDLVLLDAGLPDIDGFSLCRWLRSQHRELPIVMVTARDAEIDIIVGLDAGATDYVTKPFSTAVLLARVRAHLRTGEFSDPDAPVTVGPMTVYPTSYRAMLDDTELELRPREFQLLLYLARGAGRVVTREQILSDVWDTHWDTQTKTVDMHIGALRRLLDGRIDIINIRGVGFRLEAPAPSSTPHGLERRQ